MKYILIIPLLILFLISCSSQKIAKLISKTPKISYQKPANYAQLNKYQKDAVYLTELVKQTYPRLNSKISDSNYLYQSQKLIENLSGIENDLDFEIQIQKFMALLKDGHSNLYISFPFTEKFPIYLFKEKEKWLIGNIDKCIDSAVIGSKIISINEKPINEIEKLIQNFECAENFYCALGDFQQGSQILPKYWEAIGAINKGENLRLVTSKNDKTYTFEIERKVKAQKYYVRPLEREFPFTRKQNNGYYYKVDKTQNFAYLQMNTSLDYVCYKDGISNYTNFLTRPIALMFLKKQTKDARNFGLVLQSLFKQIENDSVHNLVIDLRNNRGGDERTGKQLLWYITEKENINRFTEYLNVSDYFKTQIKVNYKEYNALYKQKYNKSLSNGEINLTKEFYNQPYFYDITKENSPFLLDSSISKFRGKVYVLAGNNTFSAGMVLATTIADNKLATIVGQPTGNKPSTQTGSSLFKLPNTKTIMFISYLYIERPDTTKNQEDALYPDIEIIPTLDDMLNGKDKAFEYIFNEIKK